MGVRMFTSGVRIESVARTVRFVSTQGYGRSLYLGPSEHTFCNGAFDLCTEVEQTSSVPQVESLRSRRMRQHLIPECFVKGNDVEHYCGHELEQ